MTPFIKLTHANLHREIEIVTGQLFGLMKSADGSTLVLSIGSTTIPVKESPDEIKVLVQRVQEKDHTLNGMV